MRDFDSFLLNLGHAIFTTFSGYFEHSVSCCSFIKIKLACFFDSCFVYSFSSFYQEVLGDDFHANCAYFGKFGVAEEFICLCRSIQKSQSRLDSASCDYWSCGFVYSFIGFDASIKKNKEILFLTQGLGHFLTNKKSH